MLPRARAVTLTNYHEVARFVGLDSKVLLSRAGLRSSSLDNPDQWLPAANVLRLIDHSAIEARRDDFGVLLAKCRTFTSLGPVSLLMKHEATVRDIFLAAAEFKHLVNDLLNISITDDGEVAFVEWNLLLGLHSTQGINLIAAIAYRLVSEALESNWEPDCIHFRHTVPTHAATFRNYFRCPLEFDSNFDGMSCSSTSLRTPNPFADAELAEYARRLLNLLPNVRQDSASDKVRSVILLLIENGHASAERVAECLGVNVRTLQRRLSLENTSFNALLSDIRKGLVVRYLTTSSHSLEVVAQLAGYSSLSAFTRWFAAEFGMPPNIWRKQNRHEAFAVQN